MKMYVAAKKVRDMREWAREREVRMMMCFLSGGAREALGDAFASESALEVDASAGARSRESSGAAVKSASGSALEVDASAGAGSCESSGTVSESAAVIWGDECVGAAGEGD